MGEGGPRARQNGATPMIPATIATAVAPETIARVTRLFNNTAFDVVTLCGITSHAFS